MAPPEVITAYGKIRGSVQKSSEGIEFCSFKGIPYAKPPIGNLRFKVSLKILVLIILCLINSLGKTNL